MGWLWAAGFLLRRLRAEAGIVALLLALVAATSFVFAAAPRLFNLVADRALVHELEAATAVERDIQLTSVSITPSGRDPLQAVDDVGGLYLDAFPDSIRRLIGERRYAVTTPRFEIADSLRFPTFIALRYQDGLGEAIQLVDGRMPAGTGEPLPRAVVNLDAPPPPELPVPPPRIEIAVSEATASVVGLEVGDTLGGALDQADPILRLTVTRLVEVQFEVVGIFSIDDPAADLWFGDRSLHRPEIRGTDENPLAYATALIGPDAYADITVSELPLGFAWRFFLAPELADVGQLDAVVPDLVRMQSQNAQATFGGAIVGDLLMRTELLEVIGRYQAQRSASEAVLSVAAIGPFALAIGAIGMVAILLVLRRRTNLDLARSRGASGFLILVAQLWEALLVAGAAIVLGLLLAVWLVPGRESWLSPLLALASGVAAAAVLVAATWPVARRRLGQVARGDPPLLPASPRRLVLELTAVGLAIAGVLLMRQRGLVIGNGASGGGTRFDPFLAAIPVLAGLATGVVAMRLYPLPIRGLGWLAARRRGLVAVLGLRNVGRHSAAANLPLLVLVLIAAFGSFTSAVMSSIDRGQMDAAWAQVGADYRISVTAGGLDSPIEPVSVAGVEAVAAAWVDPAATYADQPTQRSQVVLHAIDPVAYETVTAGTPIEPTWPASFDGVAGAGAPGSDESPIPAIISERRPSGGRPLGIGDRFTVEVAGDVLAFEVVDQRPTFPGVRSDVAFVIVSLPLVQEAHTGLPLTPSVLLVSAASGSGPALTALVREASPSSAVTSRYERYAIVRAAPFVAMVSDGFNIALAVAVLYAGLAIVAALTLTASRRSQDLAFLRTLGLSARQSVALTVVEHGPPVVLALVPGIGLGITIAALLADGLGLAAFVGPDATFGVHIEWGQIALLAGALVLVVTIAGAASTWLARRASAVDALRLSGE